MSKYPHPIFRHYLEGEDDKPYYTMNSLAFYYEDMARKQKLIESLAKSIAGYDIRLTDNLESIEKRVADYVNAWDGQVDQLPKTVNDLLTGWVKDGTVDTIIEDARLELKADKSEVNELTVKLTDIDQYVSTDTIVAKKFGLIENEDTDEAATINTQILNDLLNTYSNILLDGVYYVNDITRNQKQETLILKGNFELHNRNCLNHILSLTGRFKQEGSMYVDGNERYIDGLVFRNINGSIFDKITTRFCRNMGIRVKGFDNNNSVVGNYIRSEWNGDIKNQDLIVREITGNGYAQRTKLEITNLMPASVFTNNTAVGVIVSDKFYEVTSSMVDTDGKQFITVRPNIPKVVGETIVNASVLLGAGLFMEIYNDTNWWNIGNFISVDRSVGAVMNTLYGHTFGNILFNSPKVGFIVGTNREAFNSQFSHIYTEPDVPFPIVTYRGKFTLIEPLSDYTAAPTSVYLLMGENLDTSEVGVIVNGNFYSKSKTAAYNISNSKKTLEPGKTLFVNEAGNAVTSLEVVLKTKKILGYTVKDTATVIYLNRYNLDGDTWNKSVKFVTEEGYIINDGISEYTFDSLGAEKYVFYATFTGDKWYVVRVKAE